MTNSVNSQAEKKSIISLKGVSKTYDSGKTMIIKDLDLEIEHGTFLTILGPSGCGKTTVLRMIAGLESLSKGQIFIDGEDVTALGAEKRKVNTVFQSYALFPHMTIFENVAFGLRMQKVPQNEIQERVLEALDMVKLKDYAERKPSQLSGGQQQRVAIARAVVNKPKVLLLDESLSALDYQLRLEMQNELKRLQRRLGISFIFVTHDQEEALTMSDRIIVMNKGVVVQDGSPREIYEDPANLFVAEFIGEINVFKAKVLEDKGNGIVKANVQGYITDIHTQLPVHKDKELLVLLRPEDLIVTEVNSQGKALEGGAEVEEGIVGTIVDLNYKGMTLDSRVRLPSGQEIVTSEFFNEDDPSKDHKLGQKVAITWHDSWEVVLEPEEEQEQGE